MHHASLPSLFARLVVGVSGLAFAWPAAGGTVTEWRVIDGGNGHWYEAVNSAVARSPESWFSFAQGRGGYVVSIRSAQENAVVYSIAWQGEEFTQAVIGGRRLQSNGPFGWISGESWDYAQWARNEPSCSCERYLMLYTSGWNDTDERPRSWAIVEYEADCNRDGRVDFGQVARGQLWDANGNRIPDCCESGQPCASLLVEWPVASGGNGHWYRLDLQQRRWTQSRDFAAAEGGRLACVESSAEHAWLRSAFANRGMLVNIGGQQQPGSAGIQQGWSWLSGAPLAADAPIGFDDSPCDLGVPGENGEQDFLHLSDDWSYFGDVNDLPYGPWNCASPGWTLVEFDADCNGDGLVDMGQIWRGEIADLDTNGVPDCCERAPSCRACPADVDGNRVVDGADIALLLLDFGPCAGCPADLDGSDAVDSADVSVLLLEFGACP